MKRKIDSQEPTSPSHAKRQALETETHTQTHQNGNDTKAAFHGNLLDKKSLNSYRDAYATSKPYPHAVVPQLIESNLLRAVRSEIITHIHFTPKETDIYKIHQSGDLANLSNLDTESLKHLPNLVKLRNALYSPEFRSWISEVTGAGNVSGRKTDMAVNVYTPGSYLLCHDDVIGSRRVSYILYLTDPDKPWKAEWGGGLRLHDTEEKKNNAGETVKVPLAEHSVVIPPAFGQLSFFAVRPGESYHDVEEVYHANSTTSTVDDGGRVRMAISGWYHIPQEGEDGFEEGIEQSQAQRSSLAQLKGSANEFDEPQVEFKHYDEARVVHNSNAESREIDPGEKLDQEDDILTEQDLTFLLHYISPSFLTPDMTEQFAQSFETASVLQLERFFSEKFASELNSYIKSVENGNPPTERTLEHPSGWPISRPPHKHRYTYLQSSEVHNKGTSPVARILADLLHSHAFKKWLALVTGLKTKSLVKQHAIARRFRKGKDYALANPYKGEQPQIEFTIGITPSEGWDGNPTEPEKATEQINGFNGTNGRGKTRADAPNQVQVELGEKPELGGEEVYMAGDDEDEEDHVQILKSSANGDAAAASSSSTSKPDLLPQVGKKVDPAVYKSAQDDEDDGILFSDTPSWNQFNVVLRDKGTLRFVKYVSQAAKGDRWDIKGEVELSEDAFEGEDEDDEEDGGENESLDDEINGDDYDDDEDEEEEHE